MKTNKTTVKTHIAFHLSHNYTFKLLVNNRVISSILEETSWINDDLLITVRRKPDLRINVYLFHEFLYIYHFDSLICKIAKYLTSNVKMTVLVDLKFKFVDKIHSYENVIRMRKWERNLTHFIVDCKMYFDYAKNEFLSFFGISILWLRIKNKKKKLRISIKTKISHFSVFVFDSFCFVLY